jgi:hypothetical protein
LYNAKVSYGVYKKNQNAWHLITRLGLARTKQALVFRQLDASVTCLLAAVSTSLRAWHVYILFTSSALVDLYICDEFVASPAFEFFDFWKVVAVHAELHPIASDQLGRN